jgi:hypothetical protein
LRPRVQRLADGGVHALFDFLGGQFLFHAASVLRAKPPRNTELGATPRHPPSSGLLAVGLIRCVLSCVARVAVNTVCARTGANR